MGDILKVRRKKGGISYKARIRREGVPLLTKTFRSKKDALRWIELQEKPILKEKEKFRKVQISEVLEMVPKLTNIDWVNIRKAIVVENRKIRNLIRKLKKSKKA